MLCIRAITSSEGQAGSTRPVRLDTRTGQAFSIPVALTADNHFCAVTTSTQLDGYRLGSMVNVITLKTATLVLSRG